MREPPRLTDSTIVAVLRAHYDIAAASLVFLPLGADAASYVYRVQAADGATLLLKARSATRFSAPSLLVPGYLHSRGLPHILAPVPTRAGAWWIPQDDFVLSLYPFIDGSTVTGTGMSEQLWRELGATMRRVHDCPLPADLRRALPIESFVPSRRDVLDRLAAVLSGGEHADPFERELAGFWNAHRRDIDRLVARADALGSQLRQKSVPAALCHADLHTWNMMLDGAGGMWLIDWDETMLALKERDLMFVIGGIGANLVRARETECFLQGYGDSVIDATALTYYRYAWAVQDMGAYGESALFTPGLSDSSRRDAVRGFIVQFSPGNIVDIAFASDGASA